MQSVVNDFSYNEPLPIKQHQFSSPHLFRVSIVMCVFVKRAILEHFITINTISICNWHLFCHSYFTHQLPGSLHCWWQVSRLSCWIQVVHNAKSRNSTGIAFQTQKMLLLLHFWQRRLFVKPHLMPQTIDKCVISSETWPKLLLVSRPVTTGVS